MFFVHINNDAVFQARIHTTRAASSTGARTDHQGTDAPAHRITQLLPAATGAATVLVLILVLILIHINLSFITHLPIHSTAISWLS